MDTVLYKLNNSSDKRNTTSSQGASKNRLQTNVQHHHGAPTAANHKFYPKKLAEQWNVLKEVEPGYEFAYDHNGFGYQAAFTVTRNNEDTYAQYTSIAQKVLTSF